MAVAADVPQAELGALVGFLSAADGPGPWPPASEADVEFGDFAGVAFAAVLSDRFVPGRFGHRPDGGGERIVDPAVDGEPDVAGDEPVDEPLDRPGRVGPGPPSLDDQGGSSPGEWPARSAEAEKLPHGRDDLLYLLGPKLGEHRK